MLALVIAFPLAYTARATLPFFSIPVNPPPLEIYLPTAILQTTVILTIFYFSRLYHQPRAVSRFDEARSLIGGVSVGALMVSGLQELFFKYTFFDPIDYPRSLFFYVLFISVFVLIIGRALLRTLRHRLRRHGFDRDNLLIIGMGKPARDIARRIEGSPELGYNIVGVLNVKPKGKRREMTLSGYEDLPPLIDAYRVEQVIIALPDSARGELLSVIAACRRGRVDIKVYPDMFAFIAQEMSVDELGGTPLITVRDIALRGWKLSLKRGLDVFGALTGLILLSPFMLLTALLIQRESRGSVFYTQERMGLDGQPFQMIKFRSMRLDAEANGAGWTTPGDPRVTRIGAIMRKTNWDEIPQLINVLLGEMSLVGPRPERAIYVQEFRRGIPRYMERHREKAGMTGWAQVNGLRGDTSIADRTEYDLWYVENWSLWLDIKIIARTVINTVLRRDENAY